MKNIVYILLIVFGTLFIHNKTYSQSHSLNHVKIESAGFDTETIIDVSCEAFAHTFNDGEKKIKNSYNKTDLYHFQSLILALKPVKAKKSLDVRGSITYYYGKTGTKYCFDVWGYFYKDGKYYYNKNLLIYISDKVYSYHPKYLDTLRQYE